MRTFMWKPFDQYFESITARFANHAKLFLLEMDVLRTSANLKLQAEMKDEQFLAVQKLESIESEVSGLSKIQQDMSGRLNRISEVFSNLEVSSRESWEPAIASLINDPDPDAGEAEFGRG